MKRTAYLSLFFAISLGILLTFAFKPLDMLPDNNRANSQAMMFQDAAFTTNSSSPPDMEIHYDMDSLARDMDHIQSYSSDSGTAKQTKQPN